MKMKNEKIKRTYVKLGFSHIETAEIVSRLNKLLANYQIHYQKLRCFHWNVEGSDFFELHEKFQEEYIEVNKNIDEIAERIRVFGKRPHSTLTEYLKTAEIREVGEPLSSSQMVKEILEDYEKLLSFIYEVTDSALEIGDSGTVEIMTGYTKKLEKSHWMFTAWSKNTK